MKLNLCNATSFDQHRAGAGWSYAMSHLAAYHCKSGIYVDDFIEKTFSWEIGEYYGGFNKNKIPYNFPWVGILHNPPNVPDWFFKPHNPESILSRDLFKESLKTCRCLIVLSDYLKNWLSERVNVPVVSVKHPTPIPNKIWSYRKFIKSEKRLVQLGYWLRDFDSICRIKVPNGFSKHIMPSDENMYKILVGYMEASDSKSAWELKNKWANTSIVPRLSVDAFDDILTSSIVYLNLYDSSANNAIIECIARNTPILINKIEPVIEYLGPQYPLYFETEEEATSLLFDKRKIFDAHQYLKFMNKKWIRGEYFAQDLVNKVKKCIM